MKIKHNKEHFLSCNVAAFTYCDGCEVFNQLKIGKKIRLVREDENVHDHKAVAIFFGDTHIGYIPRQQNETISKFLDLGYADEAAECLESSLNITPEDLVGGEDVTVTWYLSNANKDMK